VGRSISILPADGCSPPASPDPERISVYLGRGRAFGSGLHETTVSCLEEIEKLEELDGCRVLDVGTGTGILAISALLLGADRADSLDIEADAAALAAANARLNGLQDVMNTFCGTLEATGTTAAYDLVMANIQGDIIQELAGGLADRLAPGGHLLLSGIDFSDSTQVKQQFARQGLTEIRAVFLEDFVTQLWTKAP
jgi:ribosomal protein L11 methyltransferase